MSSLSLQQQQQQQQQFPHADRYLQQEQTTVPVTPTMGDFDQINSILAGATINLPSTTIDIGEATGGDSCGPLDFIDLNLQFDATELANDAIEGQVIEIPSDVLSLRRRRNLLPSQFQQGELQKHDWRNLQECPPLDSGVDGTMDGSGLLDLIRLDLELNFGKEINALLADQQFQIPKTKIRFDELASTLGGRRRDLSELQPTIMDNFTRRFLRQLEATKSSGNFMSVLQEFAGTANAAEELSLVWGKELSDFLNTFDFSLEDDFTQTQTIDILGLTFELTLTVKDVFCDNFQVEQVAVDIDNNSADFSNIDVNLAASITKLTGDCSGFVSYGIGSLNAQARFDATLGVKSLDLDVTFAGGALTVNSCSSEIRVLNVAVTDVRILFINVSDEIASSVLGFVQDLIFGFVENAANERTCGLTF